MSLLKWRDRYSIGIEAADRANRMLIQSINELYDVWIVKGREPDVEGFFNDLFNLLCAHFNYQEQVMNDCRLASATAHKNDHERLLIRLRAMIRPGSKLQGASIAALLDRWFMHHFINHDAVLYRVMMRDARTSLEYAPARWISEHAFRLPN